jgi:putative hydrolase of the HAD superfamily|tara:strand:- start:483 stop:1187 length:705 start_codon:yes stop_codon:yes gene_type:complete
MNKISSIGFDADDTLWESEVFFSQVEKKFTQLINSYEVEADIGKELYETEKRNLSKLGYGVKSFTLSMIESSHHLTQGSISSADTVQIVQWGKELLHHPVNLLPGVVDVLSRLQGHFAIYVITKGDNFHQQQKFVDSGLATFVTDIEIVQEKDSKAYKAILTKMGVAPEEFLMVGNSVRSDILPVLEIGSQAVHIPHETTWQYETEDTERNDENNYTTLESIRELPDFLSSMNS